jgi:hypothetical protein
MKRLNSLVFASLTALAAFVAVEVLQTRTEASHRSHQRSAGASAESLGEAEVTITREARSERTREDARLAREMERDDVQRRLQAGAPGTYISEMLLSHDSALARWPDRRYKPLKVWLQPSSKLKDWSADLVPIVREAFVEWSETGIPVAFSFVADSQHADVHVTWIDKFDEPISGKTLWAHDEHWWIVEANIVLAVHHRSGEVLDASAVRAIALHEVGHLIGLDHTNDSTNIMTSRVRVRELSPADRATAQLLYMLPPGPIGGSRRAAEE